MKRRMKKNFIFLFVTAVAVLLSFLLSACMDDCFHQFGEWSPLFDATCESEGMDVRTCTICGYSETQTHPKSDHTYGAARIDVRPTCVDTGSGTKTCTVCGRNQTVTLSTNPSAHKWGTPTVRPATCAEDGESVRICELCETVDTVILPAEHRFEDALSCHDRTCNVCNTVVTGDGNHTFVNDACACGTPHPDFTISKAVERIRNAMAKTLAHDGDFSVTVTDGDAQEVTTFFPLLGELAHFYGRGDTAPTLDAYTLRQHGTLYYYDLTEMKAYLTSTSTLRNQISIKALFGKDFKTYQPLDDESSRPDFTFASDGTLTLIATLSLSSGTVHVTYTEQKGVLTALTVRPVESGDVSELKYAFLLAPSDKVFSHPSSVRESNFAVSATYSVYFIASIGTASERFYANTGASSPLPVGEEADPNYYIDGWYYDMDYTVPYEESTVPYTPFPLTLYAKTSLKPNTTYLTLHIVGLDVQPMYCVLPVGDGSYLENFLRAAFPTPAQSNLAGLYTELGYTCLGVFTDSECTVPLDEALPAGEFTAYVKVEPYETLTLKFPTDLSEYPSDLSYYYPKNTVPSISAETFANALFSRTGKCFTLWLDSRYTVPYAQTFPENGIIYLKHVPQENCIFLDFRHAETGKLLYRIETLLDVEIYLPTADSIFSKNPADQTVCTGIWFDSECTQSAEGELITPEGELIFYCTFDVASPDSTTFGQDALL